MTTGNNDYILILYLWIILVFRTFSTAQDYFFNFESTFFFNCEVNSIFLVAALKQPSPLEVLHRGLVYLENNYQFFSEKLSEKRRKKDRKNVQCTCNAIQKIFFFLKNSSNQNIVCISFFWLQKNHYKYKVWQKFQMKFKLTVRISLWFLLDQGTHLTLSNILKEFNSWLFGYVNDHIWRTNCCVACIWIRKQHP